MAEKRKVWRVKDASGAIEQVLVETSAEQVKIADSAGNFTSDNVEGALAEVAEMAKTGGVTQVNGKTGNVTLTASDVGAEESGAVSTHNTATNAHGGHFTNTSNPHNVTKAQVGLGSVTNDAQVKRSEMGVASGVATLDTTGKVPSSQLPSYVDDVLEYANKAGFPATGEEGKIYVDKNTNLTWRWSGTAYVEISPSLALGETSSTAYAGNKGKANADKIAEIINGPQTVKKAEHADEATHATSADTATSATSADKVKNYFTVMYAKTSGSYLEATSYDGSASKGITLGYDFSVDLTPTKPLFMLRTTGVSSGSYSAVTVDTKGRVTAGGKSIEWGASGVNTPSNDLMVGGLFFELQ